MSEQTLKAQTAALKYFVIGLHQLAVRKHGPSFSRHCELLGASGLLQMPANIAYNLRPRALSYKFRLHEPGFSRPPQLPREFQRLANRAVASWTAEYGSELSKYKVPWGHS